MDDYEFSGIYGSTVHRDEDGHPRRGWKSLRGKVFQKDKKKDHNGDEVNDFLSRGRNNSITGSKFRLPGTKSRQQSVAQPVTPAADKWIPTKPQRRPGLIVAFAPRDDEVIGEGGQECEEPTLTLNRKGLTWDDIPNPPPRDPPGSSHLSDVSSPMDSDAFSPTEHFGSIDDANDADNTLAVPGNDDEEARTPSPLRRVATGPDRERFQQLSAYDSDDDEEVPITPVPRPKGSPPPEDHIPVTYDVSSEGTRNRSLQLQKADMQNVQEEEDHVDPNSYLAGLSPSSHGGSEHSPQPSPSPRGEFFGPPHHHTPHKDVEESPSPKQTVAPKAPPSPPEDNDSPKQPPANDLPLRNLPAAATTDGDAQATEAAKKSPSENGVDSKHSSAEAPARDSDGKEKIQRRPTAINIPPGPGNKDAMKKLAQEFKSSQGSDGFRPRARSKSEAGIERPKDFDLPAVKPKEDVATKRTTIAVPQGQPSPSNTPVFPNHLAAPNFLSPPSSADGEFSAVQQRKRERSQSVVSFRSYRGRDTLNLGRSGSRRSQATSRIFNGDNRISRMPSMTRKSIAFRRSQFISMRPVTGASFADFDFDRGSRVNLERPQLPEGIDPDQALKEVNKRLQTMSVILTKPASQRKTKPTLDDWSRASLWWFLRGKRGVEAFSELLDKNPNTNPSKQAMTLLTQHHLNLAKGWWICTEILPSVVKKDTSDTKIGYQERGAKMFLAHLQSKMKEELKILSANMRRQNVLPSDVPVSGLDTCIWIDYPTYKDDIMWNISGHSFMSPEELGVASRPLASFGLCDTDQAYSYLTVFGRGTVREGDDTEHAEKFPLSVSIMRRRGHPGMGAIISSQDHSVCIPIRAKSKTGIVWDHVRWDKDYALMRIKLPHKIRLLITFSRQDFDTIFSCLEADQKIWRSLNAAVNEQHLHTFFLKSFQYFDSRGWQEFPSDRFNNCKCAVNELLVRQEGVPNGYKHNGYRLAIVTDPWEKHYYGLNITIGQDAPIEYSFEIDDSNETLENRLELSIDNKGRNQALSMSCEHLEDRDMFRDMVSATILTLYETVVQRIPVQSVGYVNAEDTRPTQYISVDWPYLQVIDRSMEREAKAPLPLDSLRLIMLDEQGSMVDRLSAGPNEIKLRLDCKESAMIQLLRPPRNDLIVAIGPEPADPDFHRSLFQTHQLSTTNTTIQSYRFPSTRDLHAFQKAITGFQTLYDGHAVSWSIAKRRKGMHGGKSMDNSHVRLQVVRSENSRQLLAFFDGYALTDALNFELKPTDAYEAMEGKTGLPAIKLVDAKFMLPGVRSKPDQYAHLRDSRNSRDSRGSDSRGTSFDEPAPVGVEKRDNSNRFVDLENVNYPYEQDDIILTFKNEQDRDTFAKALPAHVSHSEKKRFFKR